MKGVKSVNRKGANQGNEGARFHDNRELVVALLSDGDENYAVT
jgi:hypothetical protein